MAQNPRTQNRGGAAVPETDKPQADTGEFRVVCAGLTYRLPGDELATAFAMKGQHVKLDPGESKRLLKLGAIVPKGDKDPTPVLVVSDNPDNPYGGISQVDPVEHARRIQAEAHAKAAAATAVQAPQ